MFKLSFSVLRRFTLPVCQSRSLRGGREIVEDEIPEETVEEPAPRPPKAKPKANFFQKSNNTELSNVMLKVKSKKMRHKYGLFMVEGKRLILDACSAGVVPALVFYTRQSDLDGIPIDFEEMGTRLVKIPYKDLQTWSDLTTCPGIIAIFELPERPFETEPQIPVTVVCDQIREPGNIGSIIRNCAGVGVESIQLTKGCADIWDSKVLRSAMGAHFRVSIEADRTWDDLSRSLASSCVLLADNRGEKLPRLRLPISPYDAMDYSRFGRIALIVGGETEGLSSEAMNLSKSLGGSRITIPLSNNVDSLNSSHALAVILFEIRRQLNQRKREESDDESYSVTRS